MERLVHDQDHLGKMYTEIRRKNMFDSPILIFHYFSLSFWLVIFHSTADSWHGQCTTIRVINVFLPPNC